MMLLTISVTILIRRWRKCNVANLYYKRINITVDDFFLSFDFMVTKQMLHYELSNLKDKLKNEPQ